METQDLKDLKKRYLIWFYKVTKEALDRIERKFTQVQIDRFISAELKKQDKNRQLGKYIAEFDAYLANKEQEGFNLKFNGKELKPEYAFLSFKLKAIEKAVTREFGKKVLVELKSLYEEEMTQRILKSTEHK